MRKQWKLQANEHNAEFSKITSNQMEQDQNQMSQDIEGMSSGRLLKMSNTRHILNTKRRSNKKMATFKEINEEESNYFSSIDSDRSTRLQDSQRVFPIRNNSEKQTQLRRGSLSKTARETEPGLKYQFDLDIESEGDKIQGQDVAIKNQVELCTFAPNIQENNYEELNEGSKVFRLRHLKQYRKCIILPDDPWKVKWNIFLIIVILISSIVTPVRVAFYDTDDVEWSIIETLIDAVFFFDIVFSFLSAYYNKMEALISDRREIACGYLKSWFLIDVISIFPLALIANSTVNQLAKLARMPRIYKIIKTSKFIRLMKLAKIKTKLKKGLARVSSENLETERLVTYIFIFFVLCHNLSCLWSLLAKLQDFESTWVDRYDYIDSSMIEQYIAALYFIITTITTVGYGDITSKTSAEQLFCIGLMLLGVIAYSMAISSFMSAITASNERNKRLRWKLDVLSHIRSRYSVNFDLYWRLRQSLHYEHCTDMTDQQALLSELPAKLKVELSNLMYAQEIGKIPYFGNKSPNFIATVAPLLKPIKITKGEYIFLKGDSIDGIYFIKKGESAYIQRRPTADLIFATNLQGSFFGDIDFTNCDQSNESKRLFSVKALTDMDLLFLDKSSLYDIDIDFKSEIFHLF